MKNIHLLATGKASRIHFYNYLSNLGLLKDYLHWRDGKVIYITSDEKMEEGDWVIDDENNVLEIIEIEHNTGLARCVNFTYALDSCKKIILTTDQDLIKHGVQAIDDEFLEWFVKNPNCEKVDIIENKYLICNHCDSLYSSFNDGTHCDVCVKISKPILKTIDYTIIIPKEESTKCYCGHTTYCDCGPKKEFKQEFVNTMPMFKIEPNQETIEEAARKEYQDTETAFLRGAKWQAKRMYSEEDINKLLDTLLQNNMCSVAGDELIEQFKKK